MAIITSYQPCYVGQTHPYWWLPLTQDGGNEDLTNVTLGNLTLIFRTLNGVDTTGTGTFLLQSVSPAYVVYRPSVADVASAFVGTIIITGLYPPSNTNVDEVVFDPISFSITAK